MKYINLIYSDFCRISGKKLNLAPIDMGYGDPATDQFISPFLLKYLIKELKLKNAGAYSENQGNPELIKEIKKYIKNDEKLNYQYECAVVTAGGRSALTNILSTIVNKGNIILIPYPAWSGYKSIARFLDIVIFPVQTSFENDFVPTVEQIKPAVKEAKFKYPKAAIKSMILNTPNNPTGAIYKNQSLKEILPLLSSENILCIGDYTYRAIKNIDVNIPSINYVAERLEKEMSLKKYSITNNIVTMQTFGKVTLTPGLRIGYVASTNKILISKFCEKKQAIDFGGNVFIQTAFAKYMNKKGQKKDFEITNKVFEKRRKTFIGRLNKYGYTPKNKNVVLSDAGFYISFKIPPKYKSMDLKSFRKIVNKYKFIKESMEIEEYLGLFKEKKYIPASEIFTLDFIKNFAINFLPGHLFSSKKGEEYENWVRVALIKDEKTILKLFERLSDNSLKW